jgi:hypothetical protein
MPYPSLDRMVVAVVVELVALLLYPNRPLFVFFVLFKNNILLLVVVVVVVCQVIPMDK